MNESGTGKLNKGGYFLRPYSMFRNVHGRKPSYIETVLKGIVFSFSRADLSCNYGYKHFTDRLHISKASVARKVELMRREEDFRVQRKGGRCSSYTYTGDVSKAFITTPDFFLTTKFTVFGKERYLKGSEIDVLSLIYSHTWDGGEFIGSYREIAGILNYDAEETIFRAVSALFSADLIARPIKGVNGSKKNVFRVQMKTLRKHEKEARRSKRKAAQAMKAVKAESGAKNPSAFRSEAIDAANAQAEFRHFYAIRRERAEKIADRNVAKANENPQYREIAKRLREMEVRLAKAEVFEPDKLPALCEEKKRLSAIGAEILQSIGFTIEDLRPHWQCKNCSDTGFTKDGAQCDCYRSRGNP